MSFARKNPNKPRKCPECRSLFVPVRQKQPTCGDLACQELFALKVIAKAERLREKRERSAIKAGLDSLKTPTEYANETQKAFNALRRAEDLANGYGCISCGTHKAKQWHAGHYMNVKTHKALRFHPLNVHLQCSQCNCDEGGNKIEYRKRLKERIGEAAVEALESDNEIKRWEIPELIALKKEFVAQLKELKNVQPDRPGQ